MTTGVDQRGVRVLTGSAAPGSRCRSLRQSFLKATLISWSLYSVCSLWVCLCLALLLCMCASVGVYNYSDMQGDSPKSPERWRSCSRGSGTGRQAILASAASHPWLTFTDIFWDVTFVLFLSWAWEKVSRCSLDKWMWTWTSRPWRGSCFVSFKWQNRINRSFAAEYIRVSFSVATEQA